MGRRPKPSPNYNLNQGRLRIGFPGDSASGYTIVGMNKFPDGSNKVEPGKGVGGTDRSGSMLVFMDDMMVTASSSLSASLSLAYPACMRTWSCERRPT